QQVRVRAHLEKFAPAYTGMAERMDEFVRLFPVHPDYIDVFDRLEVIEKRVALTTISRAMSGRLDTQVPDDAPGLLAYDSFWDTLRNNSVYRAHPDVHEVLDRSQLIESRIDQPTTRIANKDIAKRILHGLSVHRLTTGGIHQPLGLTAADLRDGL